VKEMRVNYPLAVVLLLVAFAVLSAIAMAVKTVDVATIQAEFQGIWAGIAYIFNTSSVTVLFVFIRNLLGYAENWLEAKPEERAKIQYEARLLGATWAKYEVYVKGFTAAIMALSTGTPYYEHATVIAGALGLLVDYITRAIKSLS